MITYRSQRNSRACATRFITLCCQVRWEDQQKIMEFGTNNSRMAEIKDDLEVVKKDLDNLDDAEQELMLVEGDDDKLCLKLGDGFVECDEDYVTDYIEKKKEAAEGERDRLSAELAGLAARQMELKKVLYGRFGKNINLEES